MKVYFVDFFSYNFFIICNYCQCDFSKAIIKILVINVTCDLKLVARTSYRMDIFY